MNRLRPSQHTSSRTCGYPGYNKECPPFILVAWNGYLYQELYRWMCDMSAIQSANSPYQMLRLSSNERRLSIGSKFTLEDLSYETLNTSSIKTKEYYEQVVLKY